MVYINFVVENFFSWGCFGTQIYGLNFEFEIFKWPHMKKIIYKYCRSRLDLQLYSWNFFSWGCFGTLIHGLIFEF